MTPEKKTGPGRGSAEPASSSARKPWVKKTTVDVVLDQIAKQEKRVADMEHDLNQERRELEKLQAAKKVLEAK